MRRIKFICLTLLLFAAPASIASGQAGRAERPMAKDVFVLYNAGRTRQSGRYEEARTFKRVIRLCPDLAEALTI